MAMNGRMDGWVDGRMFLWWLRLELWWLRVSPGAPGCWSAASHHLKFLLGPFPPRGPKIRKNQKLLILTAAKNKLNILSESRIDKKWGPL